MFKKTLLGAVLVTALIFSGCVSYVSTPLSVQEGRLVTDAFGRQVEIPGEVETIAAIGGAARILTYAGCADKLVGVTEMNKDNVSKMPFTVINAEHFAGIASVSNGGPNETPFIEELIRVAPDVIFAQTDESTAQNVADKTGIPTVGIYPEGMFDETFYSALELIGEIMGVEEHCSRVIDYIKECQADLDARTKDIPDEGKPTVYTGAVSFSGAHGIDGTHALYPPFTAIHAKNVVDEISNPKSVAFLVDMEKITMWDPDIIFLNPANMHLVNEDYAKNSAFYDNLKAVRNGELYSQIPYTCNWTNMELAIADAYYAGKVIYPEQFADVDIIKKADEIFTVMLGQPFYEQLAADGYRFEKMTIGE
ncbi:MAG: ABC transporter substrate-binding protein [Firmicutes bacterium]|mgnify:CR=1 FL=1|nr:ABC transporter substrate-binding protein [Bacillota bacterium]